MKQVINICRWIVVGDLCGGLWRSPVGASTILKQLLSGLPVAFNWILTNLETRSSFWDTQLWLQRTLRGWRQPLNVMTSLLFQSYCTATLHYGLRRETENMANLSLCSHTTNSLIYICCTFRVADVQYLSKKNNVWLQQWCRKFDQNYKKYKRCGQARIFCRVKK